MDKSYLITFPSVYYSDAQTKTIIMLLAITKRNKVFDSVNRESRELVASG